MNELYESVDYNNLNFEYIDPTKDVSFYVSRDSKELFSAIKNSQIKFSELENEQNEFLNKLNEQKMGQKITGQKEVIKNLNKL